MYGRLDPEQMYPAGVPGVASRPLLLPSGFRIRLVEAGPADGRPIVLLHGWGGSAYMFRRGIDHLAGAGFHVFAPDLRGFGISDKPVARGSYRLDAYIEDLLGLLDVCSLGSVALVGHSMGGAVALHMALRNPARVRSLALINPAGLTSIPGIALARLVPRSAMEQLGRRAIPRAIVAFILRRIAYSRPALVTGHDVDEYWAPSQFDGDAHAIRATLSEFDWRPLAASPLRSLELQTLLVLGAADRLIPTDASGRAAEALPNGRVVKLAAGHCVHEELPELVYRAVVANAT